MLDDSNSMLDVIKEKSHWDELSPCFQNLAIATGVLTPVLAYGGTYYFRSREAARLDELQKSKEDAKNALHKGVDKVMPVIDKVVDFGKPVFDKAVRYGTPIYDDICDFAKESPSYFYCVVGGGLLVIYKYFAVSVKTIVNSIPFIGPWLVPGSSSNGIFKTIGWEFDVFLGDVMDKICFWRTKKAVSSMW